MRYSHFYAAQEISVAIFLNRTETKLNPICMKYFSFRLIFLVTLVVTLLSPLSYLYGQEDAGTTTETIEIKKEKVASKKEKEETEAETPTEPEKVIVGAYINDIQNIILQENAYEFDVYVWFRWKNPDLAPADTMEFMNPSELWGQMKNNLYEEPVKLDDGEFYQVVRVQGKFSRKMPLFNYPFDRQKLVAFFEDTVSETNALVYVADNPPVTVNPRLALTGFLFEKPIFRIENFQYPTTFGDPRNPKPVSYSRVHIELPIRRPVGAYFIKLLIPVFCVVLCSALMFLLGSHIDARLGIGITSLLTVVALQLTTNQSLPEVSYLVLMDKLYIGAYIFIVASLAVVIYSTRLIDSNQTERAYRVDRKCLIWLLVLYFICNTIIVAQAMING